MVNAGAFRIKVLGACLAAVLAWTPSSHARYINLVVPPGVDSVALLEFVMALEEAFHCEIDDSEINSLRFASVGAVADFMKSTLAGAES